MLSKSLNSMEYLGEIFSDGKRTDVKESKGAEDRLIISLKVFYMPRLKIMIFGHKDKFDKRRKS